jgi:hypothetical protein
MSMRRVIVLSYVFSILTVASGFAQVVPAALEVVDATGAPLGPVVDVVDWNFPDAPVVTFTVAGHAVTAAVQKAGLMFTPASSGLVDAGTIYFTSSNCTGQAYLGNWPPSSMWEPQAIVGPNNSVYLGSFVPPQAINYNSVLRPGVACAVEAGIRGSAIPAAFLQNLTPPFQPPFELRAAGLAALEVPAISLPGLTLLVIALGTASIMFLRRGPTPEA